MTLKSKIVIANLLIFGLILAGVSAVVYHHVRGNELARVDARLDILADQVITEFSEEWTEEEVPEWDDILALFTGRFSEERFGLQAAGGQIILGDSTLTVPDSGTRQRIRAGEIIRGTTHIRSAAYRQLIRPVEVAGRVDFWLVLITPLADVHSRLDTLLLVLCLTVPAALLVGLIAVYLATRKSLAPMSRMVTIAEETSARHLDLRIPATSGDDEVSRLGQALNGMMERIEAAFTSQRQFVGDASHELRTPLTAIISELEFAARRIDDEKAKDSLDLALVELDRLGQLVDQLLTLARIDANRLVLEKQPVRLDELIVECVRLAERDARTRGITFSIQIAEAVEIPGDDRQLKSVLLNIIDNALKHSPRDSAVTIELKDNLAIGGAVITVADNGPGIDAADLPRIFDRFYRSSTARSSREGSGLGLAIAKELIDMHGGRIQLASTVGKGTTVSIQLPAH
ncbi:MAG: HAMP domain-containing histidine kinase [candidate division Zixibacteria bacterium]|nr:HAMP domain-containing histidine kinase [candidate division Zixibacteria bacterium]